MKIRNIPFVVTEWEDIALTEHPGEAGTAIWRTRQFGDIRVRMVDCTPGYVADHWCVKGHILYCLEGELRTELKDGRTHVHPSPRHELSGCRQRGTSSIQHSGRSAIAHRRLSGGARH